MDDMENYRVLKTCPVCDGARLKKESLHFKVDNKNIFELACMDIRTLQEWFANLEDRLNERQNVIAREILKEIRARIVFLLDVGLSYLTLDRTAKTLSGGEAQRIRLATQIGSQLMNVMYILDEPSIGLHPADLDKLMIQLNALVDAGNTVIVAEHEMRVASLSDWIIDMGPGAGDQGGRIVASGTPAEVAGAKSSRTAPYLAQFMAKGA